MYSHMKLWTQQLQDSFRIPPRKKKDMQKVKNKRTILLLIMYTSEFFKY